MLGGHFMEAIPLVGQMDCFVDMDFIICLHLELFDCHENTHIVTFP